MLAAIARFEVRRKGERQTRANAQRAAKGGVPEGTRLKGYTTDGQIIPDEAKIVRELFEGFSTGLTLRTLARNYDLTPSTVRTTLLNPRYARLRTLGCKHRDTPRLNPRYAGLLLYKGEIVGVVDSEAIVSAELFDTIGR